MDDKGCVSKYLALEHKTKNVLEYQFSVNNSDAVVVFTSATEYWIDAMNFPYLFTEVRVREHAKIRNFTFPFPWSSWKRITHSCDGLNLPISNLKIILTDKAKKTAKITFDQSPYFKGLYRVLIYGKGGSNFSSVNWFSKNLEIDIDDKFDLVAFNKYGVGYTIRKQSCSYKNITMELDYSYGKGLMWNVIDSNCINGYKLNVMFPNGTNITHTLLQNESYFMLSCKETGCGAKIKPLIYKNGTQNEYLEGIWSATYKINKTSSVTVQRHLDKWQVLWPRDNKKDYIFVINVGGIYQNCYDQIIIIFPEVLKKEVKFDNMKQICQGKFIDRQKRKPDENKYKWELDFPNDEAECKLYKIVCQLVDTDTLKESKNDSYEPYHPFIQPPQNIRVRLDSVERLKLTWQTFKCARAPAVYKVIYNIKNNGAPMGSTTDNLYFYDKNYMLKKYNFTISAEVHLTSEDNPKNIKHTYDSTPVVCRCVCEDRNDKINVDIIDDENCYQEISWNHTIQKNCNIKHQLRYTNEFTNEHNFDVFTDNKYFSERENSIAFSLKNINGFKYSFLKVSKREIYKDRNAYIETEWTDWTIVGDMCCQRENDHKLVLSMDKSRKCDAIFTWNEDPEKINLRSDKCKIEYELWERYNHSYYYHHIPQLEMYEKRIFRANNKSESHFKMRMRFTDEDHNVRFSSFSEEIQGMDTCCRRDKKVENVTFEVTQKNTVDIYWSFPESKCVKEYKVIVEEDKTSELTTKEKTYTYTIKNLSVMFHIAFKIQVIFHGEGSTIPESALIKYTCNPNEEVRKPEHTFKKDVSVFSWEPSDDTCFTHYEIKITNIYDDNEVKKEFIDKNSKEFIYPSNNVIFKIRKVVKKKDEDKKVLIKGRWSRKSENQRSIYLGEVNNLRVKYTNKSIRVAFTAPNPIQKEDDSVKLNYYVLAFRHIGKLNWPIKIICKTGIICKGVSESKIENDMEIKIDSKSIDRKKKNLANVQVSYDDILKCNTYELKIVAANARGFGKVLEKKISANPDKPKNLVFTFYQRNYTDLSWEESPEKCVNYYEVRVMRNGKYVTKGEKTEVSNFRSPHNSIKSELKMSVRAVAVTDSIFRSEWTDWIECSCNCGEDRPPKLSIILPTHVDYEIKWDLDNSPCIYRYQLEYIMKGSSGQPEILYFDRTVSSWKGSFFNTPSLENYYFKIRKQYFDNDKKLQWGKWSGSVTLSHQDRDELQSRKPGNLRVSYNDNHFIVEWMKPTKIESIAKYIVIIKTYTLPCQNYLKIIDSKQTKLQRISMNEMFDQIRRHAGFKVCTLHSEREEFDDSLNSFNVTIKSKFNTLIYKVCVRALSPTPYLTDQICSTSLLNQTGKVRMKIISGNLVKLEWDYVDKMLYNYIRIEEYNSSSNSSRVIATIYEGNEATFPIDRFPNLENSNLSLVYYFTEDNSPEQNIKYILNHITCNDICTSKRVDFDILTFENNFIIQLKNVNYSHVSKLDIHSVMDSFKESRTSCNISKNTQCSITRNKKPKVKKIRVRLRKNESTGKWSDWRYLYADTGKRMSIHMVEFRTKGYIYLDCIPLLEDIDFYEIKLKLDNNENMHISRDHIANVTLLVNTFTTLELQIKPNGVEYEWSYSYNCDLSQSPQFEMYFEQVSVMKFLIELDTAPNCVNFIVINHKDSSGMKRIAKRIDYDFEDQKFEIKMEGINDLFSSKFQLAYGVGNQVQAFYIGHFSQFKGCTSTLKPKLSHDLRIEGTLYYHEINLYKEDDYACFNEVHLILKNLDNNETRHIFRDMMKTIKFPLKTADDTMNYAVSGQFLQKIDNVTVQKTNRSPWVKINCANLFESHYIKAEYNQTSRKLSWNYKKKILKRCDMSMTINITCGDNSFAMSENFTHQLKEDFLKKCRKFKVEFILSDGSSTAIVNRVFQVNEITTAAPVTFSTLSPTPHIPTKKNELIEKSTWNKIPDYAKIIGAVGLAMLLFFIILGIRKLILNRRNILNGIKNLFSKKKDSNQEATSRKKATMAAQQQSSPEIRTDFSAYDVDSWD